MKRYHISAENRKCSVETSEFIKGNKKIIAQTVWRYAIFTCESETTPILLEGQDIYSTLDNVEFEEAADGETTYSYENISDEEIEKLEEFINEYDVFELESEGWRFGDTTWYFDCPVEIEEIKESV